jgi:glycosyltransferase involved in cell wall biosynthesis
LRLFDAALYVGERSRVYWRRMDIRPRGCSSRLIVWDTEWFVARATSQARADLRAQLGIDAKTNVVIFAGKLVPFKRLMDLVAAAARFRAEGRDLCLLVAGAGPLESELSEAARTAGVRIRLLGFCNQAAMPQAYAAADVLVLPSDGRDLGSRRKRGARLWSPGCAF